MLKKIKSKFIFHIIMIFFLFYFENIYPLAPMASIEKIHISQKVFEQTSSDKNENPSLKTKSFYLFPILTFIVLIPLCVSLTSWLFISNTYPIIGICLCVFQLFASFIFGINFVINSNNHYYRFYKIIGFSILAGLCLEGLFFMILSQLMDLHIGFLGLIFLFFGGISFFIAASERLENKTYQYNQSLYETKKNRPKGFLKNKIFHEKIYFGTIFSIKEYTYCQGLDELIFFLDNTLYQTYQFYKLDDIDHNNTYQNMTLICLLSCFHDKDKESSQFLYKKLHLLKQKLDNWLIENKKMKEKDKIMFMKKISELKFFINIMITIGYNKKNSKNFISKIIKTAIPHWDSSSQFRYLKSITSFKRNSKNWKILNNDLGLVYNSEILYSKYKAFYNDFLVFEKAVASIDDIQTSSASQKKSS